MSVSDNLNKRWSQTYIPKQEYAKRGVSQAGVVGLNLSNVELVQYDEMSLDTLPRDAKDKTSHVSHVYQRVRCASGKA